MQRRAGVRFAKDLDFGMWLAFEAFHQNQINRHQSAQKLWQGPFRIAPEFMHQGKAIGGTDKNFGGASHAMGIAVLSRMIDIEMVMGMLQG